MPEESNITCPKAPNEEVIRMLIRANQFLSHAKEHALSNTEFDVMIAIHNLDNALEYILRILIKHFEIESVAGKSVETPEIDQLIGIISKFFDENIDGLFSIPDMFLIGAVAMTAGCYVCPPYRYIFVTLRIVALSVWAYKSIKIFSTFSGLIKEEY